MPLEMPTTAISRAFDASLWPATAGFAAAAALLLQAPAVSTALFLASLTWVAVDICSHPSLKLHHDLPPKRAFLARLSVAPPAPPMDPDATCGICLDSYEQPVRLPCRHIYCRSCLHAWWRGDENRCPECRVRMFNALDVRNIVQIRAHASALVGLCVLDLAVLLQHATLKLTRTFEYWDKDSQSLKLSKPHRFTRRSWRMLELQDYVMLIAALGSLAPLLPMVLLLRLGSRTYLWQKRSQQYWAMVDTLCLVLVVILRSHELQRTWRNPLLDLRVALLRGSLMMVRIFIAIISGVIFLSSQSLSVWLAMGARRVQNAFGMS